MENKLNIYQKLVEIRKSVKGLSKDTKGFGYNFVSGSQILRAVRGKMDELGVLLMPEIDYDTFQWEKHEYKNKKGEEKLDFIVTAKMNYVWVNAENPQEKIVVPWLMVGQQADDISKAVGTAMTYNERYYWLKMLGLPTDEDDADAKKPAEAVSANKKMQQSATGGKCTSCGKAVATNVAKFSTQKFGKVLCFDCQKKEGK